MGAARLTLVTFDGTSMAGPNYQGQFLVDFDITAQFPLEAVLAEAPAAFPTFIRGDPQDKVIPLHVQIVAPGGSTQDLIDDLKTLFSPYRDPVYIVVDDENGNRRRILVKSLGLTPWEEHSDSAYVASLEAMEPIWEAVTASEDSPLISGSAAGPLGHLFGVTNDGNERTFPMVRFVPMAVKGNANHYTLMRHVNIAWRSPLEGVDSNGLPYPIDIVDRSLDTAALIAASKLQADADDLRVWLDGQEIDRYLDDVNTTGTAVWCGIAFQPAREATVATMLLADATITVTNPEGTTAFPDSGFLLVESECLYYGSKTSTTFTGCVRGERGTAAVGHAAGQIIRYVEHEIVLVYNWTGATNPPEDPDREPIIDLTQSSNARHIYATTDGLIEPTSLRPGQWRRELVAPTNHAATLRLSQASGIIDVDELAPAAGAPNFDSLSLYAPCYLETLATGVSLDYRVDHDMLLEAYGIDEEGFETLLFRRDVAGEGGDTGDPHQVGGADWYNGADINVPATLAGLRLTGLNSRITGQEVQVVTGAIGLGVGEICAQVFQLDQVTEIRAIRLWLWVYGGADGIFNAYIYSTLATGEPDQPLLRMAMRPGFGPVGLDTADIPASPGADVTMFVGAGFGVGGALDSSQPNREPYNAVLAAGTYAIVMGRALATGGNVAVAGADYATYPRGTRWHDVGAGWVEDPEARLLFAVLGVVSDAQAEAQVNTGRDGRWRNVDVRLEPSYVPICNLGSEWDCYVIDATLANWASARTLTLYTPIRMVAAIGGSLRILTQSHNVELGHGLFDQPTEAMYAAQPSDLVQWFPLLPGVNAMVYSEATIGAGSLHIQHIFRDRWS